MKGIRGTEVRNYIKANGEEGMIKCIEQMYERQAALEQSVRDNGLALLEMAKLLDQVTTGAGAMRTQIESMRGRNDDDELPTATN